MLCSAMWCQTTVHSTSAIDSGLGLWPGHGVIYSAILCDTLQSNPVTAFGQNIAVTAFGQNIAVTASGQNIADKNTAVYRTTRHVKHGAVHYIELRLLHHTSSQYNRSGRCQVAQHPHTPPQSRENPPLPQRSNSTTLHYTTVCRRRRNQNTCRKVRRMARKKVRRTRRTLRAKMRKTQQGQ